MRKIVLYLFLFLSSVTVSAQKTVQGSGFLDDWSVSLLAGGTTPVAHASFWNHLRPAYGVEMTKYIVPEFAMGAQFLTANNVTESATVFDATQVMLLGNINLSNWLGSYLGRPRSFELSVVAGAGWGHHYMNKAEGADRNFMLSKFGLQLDFFLDRKKYAWALAVKPSFVYDMDAGRTGSSLNVNRCNFELLLGLTYHFKNANNGMHHFTHQRAYDPTKIDALNAKVNGLRGKLSERDAQLEKAKEEIRQLRERLR